MLKKVAVLVSGGGTNLQALINAQNNGELGRGSISLVVSNKQDAYALERAKKAGIPHMTVLRRDYGSAEEFCDKLLEIMQENNISLIVLAGFLSILKGKLLKEYENRIINVHPSLIPSFCGDGFYGLRVHEAAINYGVKVTGATVHFVNEVTDGGKIILQKAVEIEDGDTPEILQKRVMEKAEWKLLPKAVRMLCDKDTEV